MRFWCVLSTVTAGILLSSCSASMPRSPHPAPAAPLVRAACPELTPLTGDSFGETTSKLLEVAALYWQCRAAALAAVP